MKPLYTIVFTALTLILVVGCSTVPHPPSAVGVVTHDNDPPAPPSGSANLPETQIPTPVDNLPVGPVHDNELEATVELSDHDENTPDSSTLIPDNAQADARSTPSILPEDKIAGSTHESKIQPVLDEAIEHCQLSQEFWQAGELEKALDALDLAYGLILKVDTEDNPKLIQQKEDLRYTISRRILEIYASRHIVVNGQHNAIPLVMNPHIEREIKLLTGKERKFVINSYKRSGAFRPFIIKMLHENGLPEALSWLPLIESGFKVRAFSKARALGLWQFIPSTGYKFGLKRDVYIDERLDPVKATHAAINYLKELHGIFGDWTTALAAYNCGEGRVLRVIRSQNINYLDNFWDLYERLPLETARYVPRFLATLHILNDPAKYGFNDLILDTPPSFEEVTINRQVHLNNVATNIGVPKQVIRDLNPELRHGILPKDPYSLRIPTGKSELLLAKIDQIPLSSPPQRAYALHRVRKGETLSGIAKRYRSSVSRIKRANNMRSDRIVAGKKLKIPQRGTVLASTPTSAWRSQHRPSFHKVKRGDSLWIIARRYGTTTKKIQVLNNLNSTRLHIGQVLKISGPQAPSLEKGTKTYVVQKGDSPYTIAQKYNTSLEQLLNLNQLTTQSRIYPGQKIYVE